MTVKFKGYSIRKSGGFFKILDETGQQPFGQRYPSIEAAQAIILSRGRVMTRMEHSLVHGSDPNCPPTAKQEESEALVADGAVEGLI